MVDISRSRVREIVDNVHNWLLCAPICSADDMAQSFELMEQQIDEAGALLDSLDRQSAQLGVGDPAAPGSSPSVEPASGLDAANSIPIARIALYISELYAAALHDAENADPEDIGLRGVSVMEWRRAYLEGCKDMVEGILTRVPTIKPDVLATITAERSRLTQGIETEGQDPQGLGEREARVEPGPKDAPGETP